VTGSRRTAPTIPVVGLRRLTASDDLTAVQALLADYEAAIAERARRDYGIVLAELAPGADLLMEIESVLLPPNVLYVAEQNGHPCGTGALKHLGNGVGEIKRIYVDPAARGRGVGRALLKALVADATSTGLTTLRLETAPWMVEAHALYRSAGFVDHGDYAGREFDGIAAADGIARFMELRLRQPNGRPLS
jgi:ribosomal protein S18 acetylase RimI-like enzyme